MHVPVYSCAQKNTFEHVINYAQTQTYTSTNARTSNTVGDLTGNLKVFSLALVEGEMIATEKLSRAFKECVRS